MSPKNKGKAKNVIHFYWQHARNYRWSVLTIAAFTPIAVLSNNLIPPLILARVLDRLSRQDYIVGNPWQSFSTEIIAYAVLYIFSGLVLWRIVDMTVWKLEGKVLRDLSRQVFSHLLNQSADFHANHFSGSLVSNTNKLLGGYIRIADTTIFAVIPLTVSIVVSVTVFLFQAPIFGALLAVFSLGFIALAFKVSEPVRKAGAKHASAESHQTGQLADAITNAMAIKSFARREAEAARFAKTTDFTRQKLLGVMKPHQRQMIWFTSMSSVINAGSLAAAIISVVSFNANIALAFLIFNYTANIINQLFQFSNQSLRNYNRAIGDSVEMIDILNTPAEVQDPKKPEPANISRGQIEFNKVTFTHKDASDAIFKNLELRIKPGEKVGLVGHSGSGKTSLTRILLRFSDIQKGTIKIDGHDINKIAQDDLRSSIAYVPQEPMLFHRTIAENIGYGDIDASQEQIEWAAKRAHAKEFIDSLPERYSTVVGERGVKLSGGQRQRVAIARAMLKNAPILVLDEATSALDSESEALIQDALWKLMEGRTAIVIAHRLSTIQQMDRIVVMDKGKVVEQGTHKELLRTGGIYSKLWERQSGGFIE